jgi:surface antigen
MSPPHHGVATGYRAKRRRGEGRLAALGVAAGLALAGCGAAGPLDLLVASDPATTGAIAAPQALALGLDGPGLATARVARDAALAEALDPLGPGAPVAWRDPESGAAGLVVAAAAPTVRDDLVCRRFRAEIAHSGRPSAGFAGEACRLAADLWRIETAEPAAAAEEAGLPRALAPELPG